MNGNSMLRPNTRAIPRDTISDRLVDLDNLRLSLLRRQPPQEQIHIRCRIRIAVVEVARRSLTEHRAFGQGCKTREDAAARYDNWDKKPSENMAQFL